MYYEFRGEDKIEIIQHKKLEKDKAGKRKKRWCPNNGQPISIIFGKGILEC